MIPAIQYQVGGALLFDVPEAGVIAEAHVALFGPDGSLLRPEAPAAFDDRERTLSTTVTPEEAGTLSQKFYAAAWRYTVAGIEYRRRPLFEVRRYVAYCPLTQAKLAGYDAFANSRFWPGQTTHDKQIRLAWAQDVCNTIRSKGRNPHLVRDLDQLEAATAYFALARIYSGYGAQYQPAVEGFRDQASAELAQALQSITWYDEEEDLVQRPENMGKTSPGVRFTR